MNDAVLIHYYSQMKVNRVYPLSVEVTGENAPSGRVQIRPVIPGALVTPAVCEMELNAGRSAQDFAVTPLVRGALKDARIGFYSAGRSLTEIPVRMRGVRQAWTWAFLVMAIALPAIVYSLTSCVDWSRAAGTPWTKPLPPQMARAADTPPEPVSPTAMGMRGGGGAEGRGGGAEGRGGAGAQGGGRGSGPGGPPAGRGGAAAGGSAGRGGVAPGGPPAGRPGTSAPAANDANVEPLPTPEKLPGIIERIIVANVPDFNGYTKPVAVRIQDYYEELQGWQRLYRIAFYLGLPFLGLAIISWFANKSYRTRARRPLQAVRA
jgi:hypothetical protein